tara:strand:+ start:153 stop:539 length:387 start_codon:yes stop_codon:yes gene_type:complete
MMAALALCQVHTEESAMSNEAQATDEICGEFYFPVKFYHYQDLVDKFGDDVKWVAYQAFEEVAQIGLFNSIYLHQFEFDGVSVRVQSAMDWEEHCLLLVITLADPPTLELPEDFSIDDLVEDRSDTLH